MPIVTWSNEYEVNVKEIDSQHRKLLELVNRLHAAVESCVDKERLRSILGELVECTREHFLTEEQYMQEYEYPESENHRRQHRALLGQLEELVADSSGKHPAFCSDYDVSSDWALTHICDQDKSLGKFLNSRGVY